MIFASKFLKQIRYLLKIPKAKLKSLKAQLWINHSIGFLVLRIVYLLYLQKQLCYFSITRNTENMKDVNLENFYRILNFAIYAGKHLCWSLLSIKETSIQVFFSYVMEFSRTPIFRNICERLLLHIAQNLTPLL